MLSSFGIIFISLLFRLAVGLWASNVQPRDAVPAGYVAAPYYPTPLGGWVSSWTESYSKAAAVVKNLTLPEKVNLTTGTGYLMGTFESHRNQVYGSI